MIGFLSGILKSIKGRQALVVAGGVGYSVALPANLNFLPGQNIELFIHTHVREDALTLFGFKDEASLDLFELLLTVSGVGPKSAQAIISAGSAEVIKKAIEASNINFFTAISSIGKKGAQKIIIELKPKLSRSEVSLESLEGNSELTDALNQLGFTRNEILAVVPNIDNSEELPSQIKQALKMLRS